MASLKQINISWDQENQFLLYSMGTPPNVPETENWFREVKFLALPVSSHARWKIYMCRFRAQGSMIV